MATAGMMNEAYFTGRKEIVAWIQGKYQPSLQRVEDLCTGAVYCQIIDSIYPGTVQLSKVKFHAKVEIEFIHNFKVLQAAFVKNKLDR
jgi:RP/EB family microtubule-associated protein